MPARSAQPVSEAGRAAQRRKRWWRNACRETQGDAGKAPLRDRGNESLRRRLSEGAPSRGAHAGDGFIVGGTCSRAKTWLANELSVVKSGGKEVSHIEKNSDVDHKARKVKGRVHVLVICGRPERANEPHAHKTQRFPPLPLCVEHTPRWRRACASMPTQRKEKESPTTPEGHTQTPEQL